jgi:hypothetical protein
VNILKKKGAWVFEALAPDKRRIRHVLEDILGPMAELAPEPIKAEAAAAIANLKKVQAFLDPEPTAPLPPQNPLPGMEGAGGVLAGGGTGTQGEGCGGATSESTGTAGDGSGDATSFDGPATNEGGAATGGEGADTAGGKGRRKKP